jgi:hypothetical protein
MNPLDLFSVPALMQVLEHIHSTMDLEALPESLTAVSLETIHQLKKGTTERRLFLLTPLRDHDAAFNQNNR